MTQFLSLKPEDSWNCLGEDSLQHDAFSTKRRIKGELRNQFLHQQRLSDYFSVAMLSGQRSLDCKGLQAY